MKLKTNFILTLFLAFVVQMTFAQDKKISGTVSDKTGVLPGVSVVNKTLKKGVETDFDGKFTIIANNGDVLVFRYLGMKTIEKVVNGDTVNVILEEDEQSLNEIVITTGYDKINKKSFTGAASTIRMEDVKIDGVIDVARMLEGRTPGVSIQNISGTFGAAPKITIRGSSSIFGNNAPLYVIDGVVQEDIVEANLDQLSSGNAETLISSSIAGVNANDIRKIDILKDASATSLYGARARNGVVVITTKSGRKSSPLKVTYSLEQTVRDLPSYSQYDILDSKENLSILKELEAKGFLELPSVAQARYGGVYAIMANRTNTYNPETGRFLLENTPEARNSFLQQYELGNTDWFKKLFRQSLTQNHSLSFSGGGEKSAMYASVSFFNDPGWSVAENVNRLTFNLKNTFYFSDKFNLTLSSNASIREQRAPGTFERQTDNVSGDVSRDFDINPFSYALNTSRTLRPRDANGNLEYYRNNWADFNILEEIENNYIDLNLRDIRFQIDASYKLSEHITYDFNSAARYVNSVREHNVKENSNVIKAYNANETTIVRDANIFLFTDPENPNATPVPVLGEGGIYNKNDNFLTTYYLRNSFNYNNIFKDKHELNVLLGQELRYVDRSSTDFTGYGLQYENGYVPFTDPRVLEKIITEGDNYFALNNERERTVAFFGKATYGYDDRYIFSLTGRYDGSNRQGQTSSSRWLPTGSVSAKWNATNEDFLQDSNTVSNLAVRGSYGLVATPGSATNAAAIFQSLISNRLIPGDRETYLNISDLQNSELTWEKQYELNLGLDLGLFNNKVFLTADVYFRDIFDNVDFVRTSGIGGQFIKQGNNADVTTDGFELGLTTTNIDTGNFKWTSSLNVSYYDQKITKLENTPIALGLVDQTGGNIEGYPINSLFSFKFDGLDSRGFPTFGLPEGSDVTTGVDFQNSVDVTDYLVFEGSVDPNISGGFSNNFKYKNWSLDVLITGSGGNKVRLNPLYSSQYSDLDVFSKDFVNRWTVPGDENFTNIPVIASAQQQATINNLNVAYNAYNYSTARVADGDFLRMKNIALGYSFNKQLTDKLGLSSFSVRFQGTNLFLIYSDSALNGQDPEFYNTGGVALPIRRQFTMSLNLSI
ncbi:SusC/RagA family TonB-linked outer membrane protein [Polaribacter sp. NJDZ03]|uniref:SusC/RagA family TonB-linked outer membrane protein n=1 Tax=Polaribacter sp. NJDZ03 TaxID=2855841 RepID=UPI001C4A6E7A|nr:SusC/RagA family TonB-linked outer membrane protein [Polaribacter sp. NJDZ03]